MGTPERDDATGVADGSAHGGHIRRILRLWLVLSVICIALVFVINPLIAPESASSVAGFANLTDLIFTALAVPVALFVWLFVGYSVVVFRVRAPAGAPVEELEDGPPLQAQPWQQIAWLAVTGFLAIFLVGWGMFGFYKQTTDPPRDPLVVNVTGQQWLWTYSYPSLGVQSNELELPLRRPVEFRVTSLDVLHGFVIDGLGVAMDANPGTWVTAPTVTPTKLGDYATRCVELCGLYHSYMWSRVKVVSSAAFASWVSENGGHAGAAGNAGAS
ncbi:MAG TPA: cytochrome c oxidase subunit II [Solirubrobacteraceae bacterium]|nr:cytochrome c oxidase subunit II [Solirubrobacteraceae bacterium]